MTGSQRTGVRRRAGGLQPEFRPLLERQDADCKQRRRGRNAVFPAQRQENAVPQKVAGRQAVGQAHGFAEIGIQQALLLGSTALLQIFSRDFQPRKLRLHFQKLALLLISITAHNGSSSLRLAVACCPRK